MMTEGCIEVDTPVIEFTEEGLSRFQRELGKLFRGGIARSAQARYVHSLIMIKVGQEGLKERGKYPKLLDHFAGLEASLHEAKDQLRDFLGSENGSRVIRNAEEADLN